MALIDALAWTAINITLSWQGGMYPQSYVECRLLARFSGQAIDAIIFRKRHAINAHLTMI